ncbi:MAG TPA: glycosyltransferase family 39 protein [Acidimicrobiales bacterium]|nr:glycosyltransferase family 39 protein [Acidimicrobiales bacterium]
MTDVAVRAPETVAPPSHGAGTISVRGAPPARPAALRVPEAVVLAVLVAIAAALRAPTLGRAYWVDEGISVGIATHPLSQIPALLHRDGSPPLFYVLLHFWVRAFGTTQVATHLLPFTISLAVVVVAWWSARRLFGRTVALFAAVLAASSPFLNWYATETRMYTLVVGLGMVAVSCAVRAARDHSRRDLVGAVVAFVALLYTHDWSLYLFAVTVVALAGWAVLRGDHKQLKWVAIGAGAVVAAYLPWLPTFVYQAGHTAAPWAVRPALADLVADPSTVLGGTMGAVVAPLLIVAAAVTWLGRTRPDNEVTAVVAVTALATIVAGFLAAQVEPSWTSRYLGVALGPLLLAVAACLGGAWAGRRVAAAIAVLLVAWSVTGSVLPDSNARYAKSNAGAIAAAARRYLVPGDVVVVTQTEQVPVLAHYLPPGLRYVTPSGPVDDPGVVDWRDLVHRLQNSYPCTAVAPELAALPTGAHVLLVNPYKHLGALGTVWARTVNAQVAEVNQLFANDRGLVNVRVFEQGVAPKPYSAVVGALFVRTVAPATCP